MNKRLRDIITEENGWRNDELATMQKLLSRFSQEEEKTVVSKLCLPMIYAHWEGLVKSSLKLLAEELHKLKLKYGETKTEFFVLGMKDKFDDIVSQKSFSNRCDFINFFLGTIGENIELKGIGINTKSNLDFGAFEDLCEKFCLDIKEIEQEKKSLDDLVETRNHIAHGENAKAREIKRINDYFALYEKLRDLLLDSIDKLIDERNYVRSA